MNNKIRTTRDIVIMVGVIIVLLIFGIYMQRDISYSSQKYCDEKYGTCNWVYEEVDAGGFYITQAWECKQK